MSAIAAIFLAALIQPPAPDQRECYDFELFNDAVAQGGGKITETPSFPTVARMLIVTLEGTKEIFAATAQCVIVPPVYIDAPDDGKPVPFIKFVPLIQDGPRS
jgi:hypothetical protein